MRDDRLSPEVLRLLLSYDPVSGRMFWLERSAEFFSGTGPGGAEGAAGRWNACWAGTEAFNTIRKDGYRHGVIFYRSYLGHRVAFAIHNGRWPERFIDHVNGDRSDNRIANLREANWIENNSNCGARSDSKSGIKGVSWHKKSQRWHARIQHRGQRHFLGEFSTPEEAKAAYNAAAKRFHGEFVRASTC